MAQDRLSDIIAIQKEVAAQIKLNNLIQHFTQRKAPKFVSIFQVQTIFCVY